MESQIPSFPTLFVFFLFVFLLIKILIKRSQTINNPVSKLPPGPWKLPLVGNLHQLAGALPHRGLQSLAKKYGPLMYLKIGQTPMIIVSSPEFPKEILKTHDNIFSYRPRTIFSEILLYNCTDIAYSPYGEYWRQLRKICAQELLGPARVQSFKPIREEEVFSLVNWIASNDGLAINLTKKLHSMTYSIVSRAAFGKISKGHEEFVSLVVEALEVSGGFELEEIFPSFGWLGMISGTKAKLESLRQKASRIMDGIIDDHKKNKEKIAEEESGECETREDFIDVLLKFHDNNGHGFSLTTNNIKAVIWDIFSAGSETSSTTSDWAMVEMIMNPRVMKKAQDEVRQVFQSKGSIDETAISDMKYLKAVVKETLRLHPSAPLLLPRESQEKCEINGYDIPKKTKIIVNAWAIGRDPRFWTDPESFVPERFLDNDKNISTDFKGTNFEYIPFGAGRRICPGLLFGVVNVEFPLAVLLYHFDWKLPNDIKPRDLDMSESFGVTVCRKHDLNLVPLAYDLSSIESKIIKKTM